MKANKKTELIDEMLKDVVETITNYADTYFATDYNLQESVLNDSPLRAKAGKIIATILDARKAEGIKKSVFDDDMFAKLVDGETIVWTDVTGVLVEGDYKDTITQIEQDEEDTSGKMKSDFIQKVISSLSTKSEILEGNVFTVAGTDAILLPKVIKDLEFYEPEDIYDYAEVEIVDSLTEFYVCDSESGITFKMTGNKTGELIDASGTALIQIVNSEYNALETFFGKLLIAESDMDE